MQPKPCDFRSKTDHSAGSFSRYDDVHTEGTTVAPCIFEPQIHLEEHK
jgi:hypothetical protein